MERFAILGLTPNRLRHLDERHRTLADAGLRLVDPDGRIVPPEPGEAGGADASGQAARRLAVHECLRWGEPTIVPLPPGRLAWAVPLMCNAQVLGGLVAEVPEDRILAKHGIDARATITALLTLAELENLTNSAALRLNREASQRERDRAKAIHNAKGRVHHSLHQAYVAEEPALVNALRQGDAPQARLILNRLLVVIWHLGRDDLPAIKTYLLELLVTLNRTAVECGAPAVDLPELVRELDTIADDEQLTRWLAERLNQVITAVQDRRGRAQAQTMAAAMRQLEDRFAEKLSRDQVARHVHLSPAHFSRAFQAHFGSSFTVVLNRLRIQRASALLANTDRSLLDIALECGFQDQSYFTKVFRKVQGELPLAYRRRLRPR